MKEYVSTISADGQIVIPAEIQIHLGVTTNDQITFVIDDDGIIRVVPLVFRDVDAVVGIAGSLDRAHTWDEMLQIAYEDRKFQR